jgi:hypothetical protein
MRKHTEKSMMTEVGRGTREGAYHGNSSLPPEDQRKYDNWKDKKLKNLEYEKPTVELELKRVNLTKTQGKEVMKAISKLPQSASQNDKQNAALQKIRTFYPDVVEYGMGRDSDWYVDVTK